MKKDFSIDEALRFGWNTMKTNFWFFVGILVVAGVIVYIPSILAALLQEKSIGLSLLFRIIGWVLSLIIQIGMIRIALKFCNNEKPKFNDLFSFQGFFWRYLAGSILFGLIVAGGFILLIIPGVIWSLMFQFFGYLIIDKKLGFMDSFSKSSAITKNVRWKLLGFGLLLGLINWIGAIALLIGLFVTIPTTMIAYAYAYRKLISQTKEMQSSEVPQQPTITNA